MCTYLLYIFEHRFAKMFGARFLWVDTADDFCPIVKGLLTVKGSLLPREALANDFGFRVDLQILSGLCVVESDLSAQQSTTTSNCNRKAVTFVSSHTKHQKHPHHA